MESRCSTCNRMLFFGVLAMFVVCSQMLFAQCNQRIEVSKIVTDEQETRLEFELKVEAQQIFNGQLVKIEGTDVVLIKSFSGSGEALFAFNNLALNQDSFYRVIIEYEGEEKFLCKRRVKDIVITDTK